MHNIPCSHSIRPSFRLGLASVTGENHSIFLSGRITLPLFQLHVWLQPTESVHRPTLQPWPIIAANPFSASDICYANSVTDLKTTTTGSLRNWPLRQPCHCPDFCHSELLPNRTIALAAVRSNWNRFLPPSPPECIWRWCTWSWKLKPGLITLYLAMKESSFAKLIASKGPHPRTSFASKNRALVSSH